jgi:hypothetical protein
VHINKKPPSGGAHPATLEGSVEVILLTVVMQRQSDPREDSLIISGQTVEVSEQASIQSNPKPTFV